MITKNPIYQNLEYEAVQTINLFAGLKIRADKEGKKMDMCKAWADHVQRGVREGESLKLISQVMKKIKKKLST